MKKTYISPEAIVVRLMPTTIIAQSLGGNDEVGNGTGYAKESAGEGNSSSGKSVWDEEW